MTARLTRWGHSCVRFDEDDRHLVVDPGSFSDLDSALDGVDAILVTHEHADHLAVERVASAVAGGVTLWGPPPVVAALRAAGAPEEKLHAVAAGDRLRAAGFEVRVLGEWHEVVHPDVARIPNVGYLVDGVLHPGDAYVRPAEPPRVLLLAVAGPWLLLADAIDYARDVGAQRVVPFHDGILNEYGLTLVHGLVGRLVGDGELVVLGPGESIELEEASA